MADVSGGACDELLMTWFVSGLLSACLWYLCCNLYVRPGISYWCAITMCESEFMLTFILTMCESEFMLTFIIT